MVLSKCKQTHAKTLSRTFFSPIELDCANFHASPIRNLFQTNKAGGSIPTTATNLF